MLELQPQSGRESDLGVGEPQEGREQVPDHNPQLSPHRIFLTGDRPPLERLIVLPAGRSMLLL